MSRTEFFEQMEENRKESMQRRARNRTGSAFILREHCIPYESKNGGAHLVVGNADNLVDFWPGTGRWIPRKNSFTGYGVRSLIQYLAS